MFNELKKRIKKDKPFINLIKIKAIEAIGKYFNCKLSRLGEAATCIKDASGRLYKLRMVRTIEMAKRGERIVRLVPHILPKFYGRDRNYLLFEYLQGRMLTRNEKPEIIFQLGKMCGEANKFKADIAEKRKFVEYYYSVIKSFFKRKLINFKEYRNILKTYEFLLKKIKHEVVLGITDMWLPNFLLASQNRVFLVDELALDYNIQGYVFMLLSRLCSKEQEKLFFKGYASVNSIKFLSPTYKKLIIFIKLLESFSDRVVFEAMHLNNFCSTIKIR